MPKKLKYIKFHSAIKVGNMEGTYFGDDKFHMEMNDSETVITMRHLHKEQHWIVKTPIINAVWWREDDGESKITEAPKFNQVIDSPPLEVSVNLSTPQVFVPPAPKRRTKRGNASVDV